MSLFRLASNPRGKIKQIHKNRLKLYFHSGRSLETIIEEDELELNEQNPVIHKRQNKKKIKKQETSSESSFSSNEPTIDNKKYINSGDNKSQSDLSSDNNKEKGHINSLRRSLRNNKPPKRLTYMKK
ncbi:unnamed protein product [Brachionus calyciflorus]|uniref:Uncharacterized protein n=1 Tax=Brachionus calyciflorus TaxID=104777 RepID=A0A813ZQN1_9BILA|nr:unnamed protein product [Brachionus calyciflorus]